MQILDKFKPSRQEASKIKEEINSFVKELKKYIKNEKIIIGGSFAKDTWLKENHDIDLFIKFNFNKFKDKDISKILEKQLHKFKLKKIHGSRIYFQIKKNNIIYEIVPVLEIKNTNNVINVMDVSPLHSAYVIKNTNTKLKDEIRLAKIFFKANSLYGAETYKKAFSGYSIEILIIYYRSFYNLMKAASKFKNPEIIDPKNHYKNKASVLRLLNESKTKSPLILIDPVQKDRNITAVLSVNNFNKFIKLAKSYLKNKSNKFFIKKETNILKLKNYILIEIVPINKNRNVLGGKLTRSLEYIKDYLNREGFIVKNYDWKWNSKVYFWFRLKNENLPLKKKHFGPKIRDEINIKKFKEKWKNHKFSIEKGKIYVYASRRFTNSIDFINCILKDEFLKRIFKQTKVKKL